MTPEDYAIITRFYILFTLAGLIGWNFLVDYLSGGKVNIPKQTAIWCKKHLIFILTIGFILGHWFAQMNYYFR